MHSNNITHRNLKPENILIFTNDSQIVNIKIADSGFSKCFDPIENGSN